MALSIDFQSGWPRGVAAIAIGVTRSGAAGGIRGIDPALQAAIQRGRRLFPKEARPGAMVGPLATLGPSREAIYLLLLPAASGWGEGAAQRLGDAALRHLAAAGHETQSIMLGEAGQAAGARMAEIALGARLAGHRHDLRTKARPGDPARVRHLVLAGPAAASARTAWRPFAAIAEGVEFARELVNEPGNRLYPASFAVRLKRRLAPRGIAVEILAPPALRQLGMGALLAVGSGSANQPRLVVLRWPGSGAGRKAMPVALVGKGVTFDTGGISIKPASKMEEMKGDMAGAAAVIGTLLALARQGAANPAVGVLPLVENMVSGSAYRPGDVLTSHSGQTIEVVDTDAEGRLILADALSYAVRRFKPRALVDLATLTYSVIAALGHLYAGIFSNNEVLAAQLIAAGRDAGERLWRLPLHPDYDEHLKSHIADIRQCAPDEESADAVHAAQFMQSFVGGTPWAHLDIAGVEFMRGEGRSGGSGFAVRLLTQWLTVAQTARASRPQPRRANGSQRKTARGPRRSQR